ncbi:MAG: hypothetical protein H0U60_19665 [Blastocatellia bacterium]|jgi:hypothetical protein|nr:hypothetical protein [Blastocatellia bacterium]
MKFVKTENPITTKHPQLGELSVDVEVPQVESVEEFVQFAGSADSALLFINNAIETAAKNGGRATLRNAPADANVDELTEKVRSVSKDYAPGTTQRTMSAKRRIDTAIAALESGQELTKEELLKLLAEGR